MLKKINNETVSAVPMIGGSDQRPVKGANLFSEPYCNCFLCAKKKSGKSSVLFKIVKDCSVKGITKVLAFCSTVHKDNVWIQMAAMCKKRGILFEGHTSLKQGGVDLLEEFLDGETQPDETEEEMSKPKKNILMLDSDSDSNSTPRKSKYLAPETIIILDDLSTELKSKSVERLLKMNRHIRSKVLISSQYLNDLKPESRKQMDYFIIFGSQNKEKLITLYKDADIGISFDEFEKLYKIATDEKYSFLYIDTRNDKFRKNFSIEFQI
jgi:hypothetical protein